MPVVSSYIEKVEKRRDRVVLWLTRHAMWDMKRLATQADYGVVRRRVNGVLRVSSLNEENNEESYRSFSFRSMRLLSSRGVDLRREFQEFLALIRSIYEFLALIRSWRRSPSGVSGVSGPNKVDLRREFQEFLALIRKIE
jgi:hypothetical protein